MKGRHALHLLLIILSIITLISTIEIYENVPLRNPGKLYLKEIYQANVFCKEEELNLYYKLEDYLDIKSRMEIGIDSANKTCHMLVQSESCYKIVHRIASYDRELTQISSVVRKLSQSNNNYELMLNEIKSFDQIDPKLGYSHSPIILNLLNLIKRINYVKMIFNQKSLDDDYIGMINGLKYISTALNTQLLTYRYVLHIIQEKTYYDVTSLVSIEFLKNKFDRIDERIAGEGCTLPKLTNSIMDVLRLLEIVKYDAYLTKNHFVLYMKLPTVYLNKYMIYQTISLPFTYKNGSFVIPPKNPFYLVSIETDNPKTSVFPLSQLEKNNCHDSSYGRICSPSKPMETMNRVYTQNQESLPQVELCSDSTEFVPFFSQNNCNKLAIIHKNKLIKLASNTYYAYIVNASQIKVYCDHYNETDIFHESKIFGIQKNCTVKLDENVSPEDNELYMSKINSQKGNSENENLSDDNFSRKIMNLISLKMPIILMISSWLLLAFLIFTLLKKVSTMRPCENHVNYNRAPKIDFVCSFKFDKPELPPRNYNMNNLPYDSPRSNRSLADYDLKIHKQLSTKTRYSSSLNSNSSMDDTPQYAEINKSSDISPY